MAAIDIKGLVRQFGSTPVVDHVDLSVAEGEFVALVGPSGCGKSTLLRLIAGLDQPDAGSIAIGERDTANIPAAQRNIAMVFQNYALYPHLTVAANIATPLRLRDLAWWQRLPWLWRLSSFARQEAATIEARVADVARQVGIDHLLARKPAQLSGGQRQRVALGRAIIRKPSVFLFDEPLSNLDSGLRATMRAELVDIHRKQGVASVYVTHDQTEAMTMADRIAVMLAGRILQVGPPATLYNDPGSVDVARMIGTPRISLIDAIVEGGALRIGEYTIGINVDLPSRTLVQIGIRAEHVDLLEPVPQGISATVAHVEHLGADVMVHLTLPHGWSGDRLIVRRSAADAPVQRGMPVGLRFKSEHVLVFDADGRRVPGRLAVAQDIGLAAAKRLAYV
jgi:multiple sugar transport system ATP-binding protein